jgi:hypothetical protein
MRSFSLAVVFAAAFVLGHPHVSIAQDKPLTPQQQRMKDCNAEAGTKSLKGDERKTFMSSCLSNKPATAAAPANSQQTKMKTCNADAATKKLAGDARKQFMSSCLKG